jgi:RNA polymerase sigma-70 factor (ECF subfamily)
MQDLTELALKAKDGDEGAVHELLHHPYFRQRVKVISRKIYSLYRSASPYRDAEDLEQDVYERVLTKLSEFRGDASILTWVDRIARNIHISQLRRETLGESRLEQTEWVPRQELSPENQAREMSLKQAINQLPQRQRTVLQLAASGLTLEDMAEQLGLSKSQVHRELKEVQRKLVESIE